MAFKFDSEADGAGPYLRVFEAIEGWNIRLRLADGEVFDCMISHTAYVEDDATGVRTAGVEVRKLDGDGNPDRDGIHVPFEDIAAVVVY